MEITSYSEIKRTKVNWFWEPYIPFGKITLIQGDPSEGKSMLALKLASIASRGGFLPDGKMMESAVNVLYQCLEDSPADTIKPRLEKNGANLKKVAYITEGEEPVAALDVKNIEKVIVKFDAKIFIIDPIQTFLGKICLSGEYTSVRRYLDQLAMVADRTGCGIILIGHLNKNEYGKDLYRGIGSVDIVAAARSILRVERIKDGSSVRVIRHIKSSLCAEGDDFAFEINDKTGVSWVGVINTLEECDYLSEQAFLGQPQKYILMKASLKRILRKNDLPYQVVLEKTKKLGSVRTMNEAKKELGVQSVKKADGWYWHLPEKENE